MSKKPLTYKKAGVNIKEADKFIAKIRPLVKSTSRPGIVGTIGGFGGFFRPSIKKMKDPILVGATDGVGTKLLVANIVGKHDTVGIDLVAMCVNDLVTCGAEPLFFLDYYATGKLNAKKSAEIVKGIAKGCRESNSALIGGETAELPGLYKKGEYDLAGFSVGIVDRKNIIDGSKVKPGNVILGLASNGIHSNGLSLACKVFKKNELAGKWGRELLKPTKIYVKAVLDLIKKCKVNALAHITGGGFTENIPRVLPKKFSAEIKRKSWPVPQIFKEIATRGNVSCDEMSRTFNLGIGMIAILPAKEASKAKAVLSKNGVKPYVIGEIVKGNGKVVYKL